MEISKYSSAYGKIDAYQGMNCEEYSEDTTNLKVSGKNLDTYERVSFAQITESYMSETYDKSRLRAIGEAGIPGAEKDFLFYATTSLMKDFYSGEISEDDVKKQIYDYVKQYADGSLGKDDHSSKVKVSAVMSDLYEYLSRANTRQAVNANQDAASEYWKSTGAKETETDRYSSVKGTVYYDSKYYKQCENMQNLIRNTLDEIADQNGASRVEYETVEKNTKFIVDGGLSFNGVWNVCQYQTNFYWMDHENTTDVVDRDFVPPDDFVYAYTNLITEKSAKSLLEYIKTADKGKGTDDTEAKRQILLMELNYGKNLRKADPKKIDDFLGELGVKFLTPSKPNMFGDYYRMMNLG